MHDNHASRLVVNLLFADCDVLPKIIPGNRPVECSPLQDCPEDNAHIDATITVKGYTRSRSFFLSWTNIPSRDSAHQLRILRDAIPGMQLTLRMVLKRNLNVEYRDTPSSRRMTGCRRIDISAEEEGGECHIIIYLSTEFLKLFSNTIDALTPARDIEREILAFFQDPLWMLPDCRLMLTCLPQDEMTILINRLQRRNLMTPYQIFLMIHAFPDLSSHIKKLISKNTIKDVIQLNRTAEKMKLSGRDISGGIYSIEEAMYFSLAHNADVSYSRFLARLQYLITDSLHAALLMRKPFPEWLSDMAADRLLHQVVSRMNDAVMALAISYDTNICADILGRHLTDRKIRDLLGLITTCPSYEEVNRARSILLHEYRQLKTHRLAPHPDRLEILLANMSGRGAYTRLLLAAGWYILSAAMKDVTPRMQRKVLNDLPRSAAMLIEDVLKGVVNPNILHDEMQIQKAKGASVGFILRLFDEGCIDLDR